MVELVDTQDLGSCASRRAGSIPVLRTNPVSPVNSCRSVKGSAPLSTSEIQFGRRGFLAAAGLGLVLTGCGNSTPRSQDPSALPDASFTFAQAAPPATMDPSISNSVETSRVAAQILEGLVKADPSTGEPLPGLAESWEIHDEGRAITFTLRRGITFHDGAAFNAEAVRANFDKWRGQAESDEPWAARTSFATVFRHGNSDPSTPSSYGGCEVVDERTVKVVLRHAYYPLLHALTQPAFGLASPDSIESGTSRTHPVGTGPFRFDSADAASVRLTVNPDYWGELGHLGRLEFRSIPDAKVRYAALVSGQVDAYDQVGLDAFAPLARSGTQVLFRDPYSVSYVGINQRLPLLQDVKVRRAIAAAIDRGAIARELFPNGTNVADQFIPARFNVDGEDLQVPSFNPQRARDLLSDTEYNGEKLTFYYPRNTSRLYLQKPEQVFAMISTQLTRVGFNLDPVAVNWNDDYIRKVTDPQSGHALSLLGWSGGFRDPDNFLGPLMGSPNAEFGLRDPGLFTAVNRAAAMSDDAARANTYRALNNRISTLLPAIPLAHPVSAVAVNNRVESFPLTSTGHELFNDLTLRNH